MIALMVFYVVLSCYLDGISMVVIKMAVIFPTVEKAGIDPIWFGVFVVLAVEIADCSADWLQPLRVAGNNRQADHMAGTLSTPYVPAASV